MNMVNRLVGMGLLSALGAGLAYAFVNAMALAPLAKVSAALAGVR